MWQKHCNDIHEGADTQLIVLWLAGGRSSSAMSCVLARLMRLGNDEAHRLVRSYIKQLIVFKSCLLEVHALIGAASVSPGLQVLFRSSTLP